MSIKLTSDAVQSTTDSKVNDHEAHNYSVIFFLRSLRRHTGYTIAIRLRFGFDSTTTNNEHYMFIIFVASERVERRRIQ